MGRVQNYILLLSQNLPPVSSYYRRRVILRIAALSALAISQLCAQGPTDESIPVSPATAPQTSLTELQPDPNDAGIIRAKGELDKIRTLVAHGGLPYMRLERAREDLQDAEDLALLRANLYGKDLLPEQADQLVTVAQRMVIRRQRSMDKMRQLVDSGVISRSEAEASGADFERAQTEMQLAMTRASLIQQMADALRLEKQLAQVEHDVESHPEWNGKLYTRYDGKGTFTPGELQGITSAFVARFARPLPISAEGGTATHRAMGFDHRGRVDVAVSPDAPEGAWLMKQLEINKIPFFAFRMAIPGKATGAHIHIGPQSTHYVAGT